jgi:DNA-binding transcriptional MerR regulator
VLFWGAALKGTFTSLEIAQLTGITLRQLQWWDEQDIVAASRSGHRRIYSLNDLAEIAIICELRRRGFSLQKVRSITQFLQKQFGSRLVEAVRFTEESYLLTDGSNIYLEDSARSVVDLLKNSRQPMLSVCLSDIIRQVCGDLTYERKRVASVRHHTASSKAV